MAILCNSTAVTAKKIGYIVLKSFCGPPQRGFCIHVTKIAKKYVQVYLFIKFFLSLMNK